MNWRVTVLQDYVVGLVRNLRDLATASPGVRNSVASSVVFVRAQAGARNFDRLSCMKPLDLGLSSQAACPGEAPQEAT
jgi:hypothetical protein